MTPYGYVTIDEMYDFVDKVGISPLETITCATLNGAKMAHCADETGSLEAGKCADLLGVDGDPATNIHDLTPEAMDGIMKDGEVVVSGTFGARNTYSA